MPVIRVVSVLVTEIHTGPMAEGECPGVAACETERVEVSRPVSNLILDILDSEAGE